MSAVDYYDVQAMIRDAAHDAKAVADRMVSELRDTMHGEISMLRDAVQSLDAAYEMLVERFESLEERVGELELAVASILTTDADDTSAGEGKS